MLNKKIKPFILIKQAVARVKKAVFRQQIAVSSAGQSNTLPAEDLKKSKKHGLSWKQIKYIPKFLSPTERLVLRISAAVILISTVSIFYLFLRDHLVMKPERGGVYTENLVGSPHYINPLYASANEVDMDIARLVFSGLVRFDAQRKIIPDLAKEWFLSQDKKKYTFILRNNVFWPDEKQFTSEDVVFTFNALKNKDYGSPLSNRWQSVQVKALDDFTVQFTLSDPEPDFLNFLTTGILPAHLWRDIPPANARLAELNLKPVGLGPYAFVSFVKDKQGYIKSYKLKAKTKYYLQPAYIAEVNFKFFPTFEAAVASLKGHNADGLSYLPPQLKDKLSTRNDLRYYELSIPQYTAIFFNAEKNQALKEVKVRQALNLLIDKEALVRQALDNQAEVLDAPFPSALFAKSRAVKDNKKDNQSESDNREQNKTSKRLAAAIKLLQQAGWRQTAVNVDESKNGKPAEEKDKGTAPAASDGVKNLTKDGQVLSLVLTLPDQPQLVKVANLIKQMWQKAGIKVDLSLVAVTDIQKEVIPQRNYELLLFGEILNSDSDLYSFWHSSQAGQQGFNLSDFKNNELDKLLEELRQPLSAADKQKILHKLNNIFTEQAPAIFLYSPKYTYVISNKIKGVRVKSIIVPSDRLNGLVNWYIKTKKALNLKLF